MIGRVLLSSFHACEEGYENDFVSEAFDTNCIASLGTSVNCSTKVGMGCILNTCCSVDHDNVNSSFGSGSVVISDINDVGTYVGVSVRKLTI